MNRIIEKILLSPGYILSFIFPYRLYKKWIPIRRRLYTGWILPNLAHIGANSSIDKDIHLVGGKMIMIGSNCCIDKHCSITALDFDKNKNEIRIEIGDNVTIGPYAHMTAVNKIVIGNCVDIGPRILITDNSKKANANELEIQPRRRQISSKGPVYIGDYTWIGENVCIMPGVTIGQSSVIGANSVVTKDIPAYCVAVGVPARVISVIK